MEELKNTYYSNVSTKLAKQKSNAKTYWSVLERFHVSYHYFMKQICDWFQRKKLKLLILLLQKQCSLINSDSSLLSEIVKKTDTFLYSVGFSKEYTY